MKYFYSHLVAIETITEKLDELDMTDSQRKHLAELIDSTIHQEVLDIIFSRLNETDKLLFIEQLKNDPSNPEIIKLLNEKAGDIESEIKEAVVKIKKELHEDVETAKRGGE
ncbi:MAG: hypothetical protein PHQ59_02050 [Candidatus Daviesbacteria bacterium]|nr:hypothetical protein [Candidatus Daviesbacteria bacterium]